MSESTRRTLAALAGAWLALVVLAVFIGVPNERDAISQAATAAVSAVGVDAAISVDGRDVTVDVTPGYDRQAVVEALAGVRGIRTVEFNVIGERPGPEPTEPDRPAEPTSTTSTSVVASSRLEATLHEGTLSLSGVVPVPAVAEGIQQVAELIYAPLLEGSVDVGDVPPATWLEGAPRAVAFLAIVPEAKLVVDGQRAVVEGSAPTPERKAKLLGAIGSALGDDVVVDDQVRVSGLTPPDFHADAPGDGTVTISGTVPNDDIAEALRSATIAAFGPDAVTDLLVVDRGTDASFSLYRLPFVIPQLAAIPQWTLDIDDDVITGSLRGGATFESGSAELSPQLQTLLGTAAGILARNPTLGIVIEGHTDSIGTRAANQVLSERRAGNAKAWLVAAGIDERRIIAVGLGEGHPIASNTTPEGRAQNRRVEFRFGPIEMLMQQGGN